MIDNCQLIKDLLPLFADDLLSEETTTAVKQHLSICENCHKEYQQIKTDIEIPIITTEAKDDARVLRRIKLTFNIILYPLLLGILMASSAVLLLLHLEDVLPGFKVIPLLICGFISYLLIRNFAPSMLIAILAAIIVPQVSSDATPALTKLIFIVACLFYVFCGYTMAWLIGNNGIRKKNKLTAILTSNLNKALCFAAIVFALAITSITTPYYSNMWEYAWTKALFEDYMISELDAKGENIAEYRLSSFYYNSYQYMGIMSNTSGDEYLMSSWNDGIGIRVTSEFEYYRLLGSNNLDEQQVLMDIMVSHNFRLKSVNDIFVSISNKDGVFSMNPDATFSPISPVYKYSIFTPHSNDTTIELQIGLDAYENEIYNYEDFERIANQAIQILNQLSLHYDTLIFVYNNYSLTLPKPV